MFVASGERKLKTNLVDIVTKYNLDMSIKIEKFPLELLDSVLFLEPPKKVIQYVPVASATIVPSYDVNKSKQPKARIVRGPKQIKPRKSLTETASIYADEDKPSLLNKRKLNEDGDDDYHTEYTYQDYGSSSASSAVATPATSRKRTPDNFDKVAGEVFDEFWNLEFDDHEITWAFFAKITSLNCKEYKLLNFADTSYSLAVIKDKLKSGSYFSVEDFVFDFHQMFANVLKYYDELHPAYRKAQELSQQFEARWAVALTKFR